MAEQEPGPWELMRAIQALERKIDSQHANAVPAKVFEIYQQSVEQRITALAQALSDERANRVTAVGEEKTARIAAVKDVADTVGDDQKFRRSVSASVGVALMISIITLVFGLIQAAPS